MFVHKGIFFSPNSHFLLLAEILQLLSYILWKNVPQVNHPISQWKPESFAQKSQQAVEFQWEWLRKKIKFLFREQPPHVTLRYTQVWKVWVGSTIWTAMRWPRAHMLVTKPWRKNCGTSATSWLTHLQPLQIRCCVLLVVCLDCNCYYLQH